MNAGTGETLEWLENSAYQLPFAEAEFDVVLCAQTLQFLEDRPCALAEIYRVLRPGGLVAVSLWCDIRENPYFHALVEALDCRIGPETAAGLRAAFSLPEANTVRELLIEAGFKSLKMTVSQMDLDLPKPSTFVLRHVSATPMSVGFQAASDAATQEVIEEVSRQLAQYETAGGIRVLIRTRLALATR